MILNGWKNHLNFAFYSHKLQICCNVKECKLVIRVMKITNIRKYYNKYNKNMYIYMHTERIYQN